MSTIEIVAQRRSAEILVKNTWAALKLKADENTTIPCYVLGFFQYIDGEEAGANALCELYDGTCVEISAEYIRFTDTDGKGMIL